MNTNCLFMSRCWLFCFRCMPALNPRIYLWTRTVCLYRAMAKQANILRTNFRLVIAGSRMLHNRTNDFEWRSIFRIALPKGFWGFYPDYTFLNCRITLVRLSCPLQRLLTVLFSLHACIKSQDFLMNTNCLFMSRCWLFCFRCMPALNARIYLWTRTVCLYRAMAKQANILRNNFRLVVAGSRVLHNRTNDFEWRSIFRIALPKGFWGFYPDYTFINCRTTLVRLSCPLQRLLTVLFSLHACIKSQDFLMNTNCLFMSRCWLFCFRCMPALNPRIFLWTCTVCLYRAMAKQANILRTNFRLVIAGSRILHNRTNDFEWRSIFRIALPKGFWGFHPDYTFSTVGEHLYVFHVPYNVC